MNLHDVMNDPNAQELTNEIMVEIGLSDAPSAYAGDLAFKTRNDAANKLAPTILTRARGGAIISPPVQDIIQVVLSTAQSLEQDQTKLIMTYEVIKTAIYGHIWIGRLIAQGSRPFNQIMAKDGVLSILRGLIGLGNAKGGGGGGCDDCGGCGSGGG